MLKSVNIYSFTPVISYINPNLEKATIIKQNKSKSGIYRRVNIINNKNYIYSSIDLGRRFEEYYNYNHIFKIKRNFPIYSAFLYILFTLFLFYRNPSAGIGRQGKFKLC